MSTKGLDRAYETTKQIITLSTGIVALTVTFAKEFKVSNTDLSVPISLKISWLFYCAAVIFGIWTLMAITGTLNNLDQGGQEKNTRRTNIQYPAIGMILSFVVGIITTIWAGFIITN